MCCVCVGTSLARTDSPLPSPLPHPMHEFCAVVPLGVGSVYKHIVDMVQQVTGAPPSKGQIRHALASWGRVIALDSRGEDEGSGSDRTRFASLSTAACVALEVLFPRKQVAALQ